MGWFSKKKNDDYLDIIEQQGEESFFVPFGQQGGIHPSHALTAGEVEKAQSDNIPMESSENSVSPLEALRNRVIKQAEDKQAEEEQRRIEQEERRKALKAQEEEQAAKEAKRLEEIRKAERLEAQRQAEEAKERAAERAAEESARLAAQQRLESAPSEVFESKTQVLEEVTEEEKEEVTMQDDTVSTESTLNFEDITPSHYSVEKTNLESEQKTNLLEKCTPFILDDDGNSAVEEEPAYTLESVESILGIPEKEEKTETEAPVHIKRQDPIITSETIVMERSAFNAAGILSDIDEGGNEGTVNPVDISDTALFTKRFDPIQSSSGKNTMTFTRIPDLKSGIAEATIKQEAEEKLIEDIFGDTQENDFEPKDEYLCTADAKRIGRKLKITKRNAFYGIFVSAVCFILSGIFSLPAVVTALSGAPVAHAVIQCCLSGIAILSGLRVWKAFISVFKKHTSPEAAIALCEILYCVCVALDFGSVTNICYMSLLMTFILFTASACNFSKASYTLSNFRFVASSRKKNAVTLIDDRPTTLSMASGSIEGDVLVAATRRVTNITDFMKNATAPTEFEGRFKILFIVFLIAAVLCGLAGGMSGSISNSIYCAFCVMALLCTPTLLMCDIMPLKFAAKRLNRKGAMIAGKTALNRLEMANACVMRASDFFPRGTVTLHNLQVLSDNSIDKTLLEAASVANALKSPLSDILCDIACGTLNTSALPQCDSVKYENRMGISGWVGDNRLFIGNYDLLKAHGITPPDFEMVKKIMRSGYFPVFIACNQKACAVLTVKYSVSASVARELTRLCNMGVTLLVNNCDPNLSEQMLCDYFGLFPDSVRIMKDAGIHMYKNRVNYLESSAAPAVHSEQPAVLPAILCTAIRTKRAISVLRVIHIIAATLGALALIFLSFNQSDITVNALYIALYEAIIAFIAFITGLFFRLK